MLESISLRNFRIHKSTDISPIGNFCALVGKNDVGKSSVLQALDMLLKGESPSWDDRQNKYTGITIEASIDGTAYNTNPENINCHYFTAENFSDATIEDYTISELINSKEDISFALQRANKFKEDLDKIFKIYRSVNEVESELDLFLSRYGSDEDIDTTKIDRVKDIIDNFLELRDVNILACDDNLQEIEQCEYLTQGINVDQEVYHQIVNDIELNVTNLDDTSDLYSQLSDFVSTGDSSIIYNLDDEDIEDEYGNDVRDFVVELKNKLNKLFLAGRFNITDQEVYHQIVNDIELNVTNLDDTSDLYSQLSDFVSTGDTSIIHNLDVEDIEDEYGNDVRDFVVELKNKLNKSLLVGRINIADIGFFNQFPKYESLLLAGSLEEILNNQDKVMADVDAFIRTYLDRDIVTMWSMILRELGKTSTDIKIVKRGSGVKRLCSLFNYAVEKYRSVSVDGRQTIFAIDEPEISLHPNQQRELIMVLKDISNFPNIQVLITTHSPYIVKQLTEKDVFVLRTVEEKDDQGKAIKDADGKNKTTISSEILDGRCFKNYFSLNEINYLAFDEPSVEYHDELYTSIQDAKECNTSFVDEYVLKLWDNQFDVILQNMEFYEIDDQKANVKVKNGNVCHHKISLPYCVRNHTHHMLHYDATKDKDDLIKKEGYYNNIKFGYPENILLSIKILRSVILNKDFASIIITKDDKQRKK